MIRLDRCNWSCNILDNPSRKIYVSNKTKDPNVKVFNMIPGTNEGKASIK